jgi:hypothetical protein
MFANHSAASFVASSTRFAREIPAAAVVPFGRPMLLGKAESSRLVSEATGRESSPAHARGNGTYTNPRSENESSKGKPFFFFYGRVVGLRAHESLCVREST